MTIWVAAAILSRWNAGSIALRERRWNSPSIVSSPSPSSGMRSPMCPSRQRKFWACETSMWWLASGPSIHTVLPWKIRSVNTGP